MSNTRLLLGARLEELRDARKLTRAALGELLGVEARQIAAYELKGMWPGPEMASAMARAFHVELGDLYDMTPTRTIPSVSIEERLAIRTQRRDAKRNRKS